MVTIVIIVLILGAFAAAYILWRPSEGPKPLGVCTVYDYVEADTVAVEATNVTTTIKNTTTYYTEWSTITPTPYVTSSSTFTTAVPSSITTNPATATYTAGFPSMIWNVTVCTYTR